MMFVQSSLLLKNIYIWKRVFSLEKQRVVINMFGYGCGGYGYGGFGFGNSFVLIVVLFILLIIVGASFI
ncbi:YjcZ family sporulation protein [Neobacillus bataviensis]|uniref:YjcZ family sporulation protein n=1 Tax=Neobacillus bataviensis TaxID=220685 RepID=UPI003F7ECECB